jgi:hypothetical protein
MLKLFHCFVFVPDQLPFTQAELLVGKVDEKSGKSSAGGEIVDEFIQNVFKMFF